MPGIVKDHRKKDLDEPLCWAVATDKFMSGWGLAPDKSYVAYPIYSHEDERRLTAWMEERHDFIRVRVNAKLPRVRDGCHLSIYDRPEHCKEALNEDSPAL